MYEHVALAVSTCMDITEHEPDIERINGGMQGMCSVACLTCGARVHGIVCIIAGNEGAGVAPGSFIP